MNRAFIIILLLVTISGCTNKRPGTEVSERSMPFDNDWLFIKDSVPDAELPGFNDSKWRLVDLPHDWRRPEVFQGLLTKAVPDPIQRDLLSEEQAGTERNL
jgi:beta-galactosidase